MRVFAVRLSVRLSVCSSVRPVRASDFKTKKGVEEKLNWRKCFSGRE